MAKTPPPYPDQIKNDFRRQPTWRWDRARDLVWTGRYATKRRDDKATRIAVDFIREINRCLSELRLRRVRQRFNHLALAHDIWLAGREKRLEIETRILAGQTDTAIGLEMGLPPPTVQAYSDVFYSVRDRIHARSYIAFQVVGVDPGRPPTPVQLMQLCAYHGGPHMIQPWMDYLRKPDHDRNLKSPKGRLCASLDLLIATQELSADEKTVWSLVKCSPFFVQNNPNFSLPRSIRRAFSRSAAEIAGQLELPIANLPPYSYAPAASPKPNKANRIENKRAA